MADSGKDSMMPTQLHRVPPYPTSRPHPALCCPQRPAGGDVARTHGRAPRDGVALDGRDALGRRRLPGPQENSGQGGAECGGLGEEVVGGGSERRVGQGGAGWAGAGRGVAGWGGVGWCDVVQEGWHGKGEAGQSRAGHGKVRRHTSLGSMRWDRVGQRGAAVERAGEVDEAHKAGEG